MTRIFIVSLAVLCLLLPFLSHAQNKDKIITSIDSTILDTFKIAPTTGPELGAQKLYDLQTIIAPQFQSTSKLPGHYFRGKLVMCYFIRHQGFQK